MEKNIKQISKIIGKYVLVAIVGLFILGWFGFILALLLTVIWDVQMIKKEKTKKSEINETE